MLTSHTKRPMLRRRRRGLALIELLVCASICAMMLTATAVAFRASVATYRDNTDRNMLLANGRVAMRQLINEIRNADNSGPDSVNDAANFSLFSQGQAIDTNEITIYKQQPDMDDPNIVVNMSASYVFIYWKYDSANRQITRTRTVNGVSTTAIMSGYVQSFNVHMEPWRSPANVASGNVNFDQLLRSVVTMTLQNVDASGKMLDTQGTTFVTERLVDAAVPRKNFSGL